MRLAFAAVAASLICGTASAADLANTSPSASFFDGWYTHVGLGGIFLSESAKVTYGGAPVPDGTIRIRPQYTLAVESGYFVTRNWAVSFSGGLPPTAKIDGAGALSPEGRLGTALYGSVSLTAHYHFTNFGPVQPYVGAGPVALLVFKTHDEAETNLRIRNSLGFAVQLGADYMINRNWGMFVDVKKALLRSHSDGLMAGTTTTSKVTLDPLVASSGLTYRF